MARGRKKTPTVLKEMQGTARADRLVENEMTADLVLQLPEPPELLSEIGVQEWYKITSQLFNLKMLHNIDLRLIEAYCNEISLYIETEKLLREKGRIQVFKNSDGTLKHAQAVPYQKIAKDALNAALLNQSTILKTIALTEDDEAVDQIIEDPRLLLNNMSLFEKIFLR